MNNLDFGVLGIFAVSILLGLLRGAVKEVLSLLAWLVAYFAAKRFAGIAAQWMPTQLDNPGLRHMGGFALVFVVVMVAAMLVSLLLSASLKAAGLGMTDHLLGMFFGALRGLVVVLALVLLAGLTTLPRTEFWRHSLFAPYLVKGAVMVRSWLPIDFVKHIQF